MKKGWHFLIVGIVIGACIWLGYIGVGRPEKFNSFLGDVKGGFETRHKYLTLQDPQ